MSSERSEVRLISLWEEILLQWLNILLVGWLVVGLISLGIQLLAHGIHDIHGFFLHHIYLFWGCDDTLEILAGCLRSLNKLSGWCSYFLWNPWEDGSWSQAPWYGLNVLLGFCGQWASIDLWVLCGLERHFKELKGCPAWSYLEPSIVSGLMSFSC